MYCAIGETMSKMRCGPILGRLAVLVMAVGCSAQNTLEGPQTTVGPTAGSSISQPTAGNGTTTGVTIQGQGGTGAPGTTTTGATTAPEDRCSGVSKKAETELLPSDIVWAIDTSGTMSSSFPAIKDALSAFSQKMNAAAIDAHIVLIAAAGATAAYGGQGFCMPAPIGSGQCGNAPQAGGSGLDSKEPTFLHVDAAFGMTEGVPYILNNFAAYKHVLRPNARTQFVVTEDSGMVMGADEVKNIIEGRSASALGTTPPWDPPLKEGTWQFNGVICKENGGGGPCILAPIAPADNTLALIASTGGLVSDLQDAASGTSDPFAELLNKLAEAVIVGAKVSCEYEIPTAPDGMEFDPNKVNVEYIDSAQKVTLIPQLLPTNACENEVGWQYNNPAAPTHVVLCPAACKMVQKDPQARVDVKFGCKTVVILQSSYADKIPYVN
jgi:hypothetical protein